MHFSVITIPLSRKQFCPNYFIPSALPSFLYETPKLFSRHLSSSKTIPDVGIREQSWSSLPTVIQLSQQQRQNITCISWMPNPQLPQEYQWILSGLDRYLCPSNFPINSLLFSFLSYYKCFKDVLPGWQQEIGFSPNFTSKLLLQIHLSLQFHYTLAAFFLWISAGNFFSSYNNECKPWNTWSVE